MRRFSERGLSTSPSILSSLRFKLSCMHIVTITCIPSLSPSEFLVSYKILFSWIWSLENLKSRFWICVCRFEFRPFWLLHGTLDWDRWIWGRGISSKIVWRQLLGYAGSTKSWFEDILISTLRGSFGASRRQIYQFCPGELISENFENLNLVSSE